MPKMTIVSVGLGKDGKEKTESVEIETAATLGSARKFVAEYCKDWHPASMD